MSGLEWQKSSFSGEPHQNCLELATAPDGRVYVRESDDPATVLTVSPAAARALFACLRGGRFQALGHQ
ncbi:DUF397 domain-containing protein [Streptomyces sp. B6B3]|uniref:DUF397 domain-containing protein n=1 Tax=Streptomyces sp. B6B3 TaxID=3153570 RepID=UPI00325CE319